MIAEIGYGILTVAFFVALYSVAAAIYGVRTTSPRLVESARRAMLLLWPLITLAAACLIYLQLPDSQINDVAGFPGVALVVGTISEHRMPSGIVPHLHGSEHDPARPRFENVSDAATPVIV